MKRAINILGTERLLEKLKKWKPKSPAFLKSNNKRLILNLFTSFYMLSCYDLQISGLKTKSNSTLKIEKKQSYFDWYIMKMWVF
ncbi:MAG: hypothetical protein EBZ95_13165 [Chitinophagia bacterium]|nr:hypothetical protein [Chitinophagia bacterium]